MIAASSRPPQVAHASPISAVLAFLVAFVAAFPVVLGLGMTHGLSHDEHQHIAAGALIAREHLLPYRDFPHFHTPYLAYVYAQLFAFSDQLLTSARLVSVVSSAGVLGIIGAAGFVLLRARGLAFAALVAAGSVVLALMTTLFTQTSGRAWNHEPSLLLALLALLLHLAGLRSGRVVTFVASGLVLGLAIGTRITCAPLAAPFLISIALHSQVPATRWRQAIGFAIGGLIGGAGLLYFFAIAPEQAWFGNFGFSQANIVYRFSTGEPRTMTIATKLRYFWKVIIRPDIALFLVAVIPAVIAFILHRRAGTRTRFELRFLLLLLPFVLMGSFAPSPLFDQYFFPLVPFLLLTGLFAFASIPAEHRAFRWTGWACAASVLLATGMGVRAYRDFREFLRTEKWAGTEIHQMSRKARGNAIAGRILTVAPTFPLEAGDTIYPAFSTGTFAWRTSPYIDSAKAARLGIITPTALESYLLQSPPTGILVGFEKKDEGPFISYAKQHGFKRSRTADENDLWTIER